MAREYRVAVHTGCGKSLYDCLCDGGCATTGKLVSATDDRDVQPLVEAATNAHALLWTARGKGPAVKAEAVYGGAQILREALTAFDSKEDTTQTDAPCKPDALSVADQFSSKQGLQELLEWTEKQAGDRRLDPAASNAYIIVAGRIRSQLQANEEKGGEG